jgi:uncharacterized membrane protein
MSQEEPLMIHVLPPENVDKRTKLERKMDETSTSFQIGSWFVLLFSIICLIIIVLVLIMSNTLVLQRKLLLGSIIGIMILGSQIMLYISRKEPSSLIMFIIICMGVSAFALGTCVWYI